MMRREALPLGFDQPQRVAKLHLVRLVRHVITRHVDAIGLWSQKLGLRW